MKLNLLASCCTALLMSIAISAPVLGQPAPQGLDESNPEGRFIVQFRDFRGASAVIRAAGGNPVLELGPQSAVAAYLPPKAIEALSRNPNIEYIEVDPRRYPQSETMPYGIPMVQAEQVSFDPNGNVMVCIMDSGFYTGHEDLQSANVTGISGSTDWSIDTCGHGTHVAGTIAAVQSNLKGVVGTIPGGNLSLYIAKVFDGAGCRFSYASGIVGALNACRSEAGTRNLVVNMSLGSNFASRTEGQAFQDTYNTGKVLSIAAAGNEGSGRKSYPASYASVISVAAVDSNKVVADFSQKNDAVELAAPGVAVLSTVPFLPVTVSAGGTTYSAANMDFSARSNASGPLVDGGLCDLGISGQWSGKVVLCKRGTNSFAQKVDNVVTGGGLAAVIFNDVAGTFTGTLQTPQRGIPAVSISQADGEALQLAASSSPDATVANALAPGSSYEAWNGTSMATPHVSGVAALVWSKAPHKTNAEIRAALQAGAEDLGPVGRDTSYGFGLVRAKAALDSLAGGGGGGGGTAITLSARVVKPRNAPKYVELTWQPLADVAVYRNGEFVRNEPNDGVAIDTPPAPGTYRYKVCEQTQLTNCSSEVSVKF